MTSSARNRGIHGHGSIKYLPIPVLFFNRELRIAYHNFNETYLNSISIFKSHSLGDQNLKGTASRGLLFLRGTGSSGQSFIGGLAHESAVNKLKQGHQIANRSLVRYADRELQDKKLDGLLDQFAKTAGSCDSVDSILTHHV